MSDAKRILSEVASAGGNADSEPLEMLLQRYLDGRLDADDRNIVDTHLRTDAAVRRRCDALREEARLLREALEPLSEPAHRLGDKVLVQLHQEERFRLNAQRNRRVRRHILTGMSVAAALALCVMLVRPRDAMGTAVSGTGAVIQTVTGERKPLTREMRVYEGDTLTTGLAQFVRLQLSGGGTLDLDEQSRLNFATYAPSAAYTLESGRVGIKTGANAVTLQLPQGKVFIEAGSLVDLWLPETSATLWPAAIELQPREHASKSSAAPAIASVTVVEGTVSVMPLRQSAAVRIDAGCRATLTEYTRTTQRIDLSRSLSVETRRGHTLHAQDNPSIPGAQVLGLLKPLQFAALGEQLELLPTVPAQRNSIAQALKQLDTALLERDDYNRKDLLAAAQQDLRLACEPLNTESRRAAGRLLEGLAHMERGRALVRCGNGDDLASALISFEAARVALEEALRIEPDSDPLALKGAAAEWPRQVSAGVNVTLRDLPPAAQTSLLAAYHHALARFWIARVAHDLGGEAAEKPEFTQSAVRELTALQAPLSRSVEGLSLRLAEAVALAVSNKPQQSQEALRVVLSTPLAGWSTEARQAGDGIKQAALLAMVRLLSPSDIEGAFAAQADFNLAYPLDVKSPVAEAIDLLLADRVEAMGDKALQARDWPTAIAHYDVWQDKWQTQFSSKTAAVRLQRLEALIEAGELPRAAAEADALSKSKDVTDTQRTRLTKLQDKITNKE